MCESPDMYRYGLAINTSSGGGLIARFFNPVFEATGYQNTLMLSEFRRHSLAVFMEPGTLTENKPESFCAFPCARVGFSAPSFTTWTPGLTTSVRHVDNHPLSLFRVNGFIRECFGTLLRDLHAILQSW